MYGKFFDDVAAAPCHFDEDRVFPGTEGGTSLLLITDRRHSLNTLVDNTNKIINQAVIVAQKRHPNSHITTANWDPWLDAIRGPFCEPGEKPDPSDPANKANWQFTKTYYDGSYDVTDWKVQMQNGGTSVTFRQ
jgi:hypothetical protein